MINVQILTKNNETTIRKTIESVLPLEPNIFIGDFGSQDQTRSICEEYSCRVYDVFGKRDTARNFLLSKMDGLGLFIEPWEVLAKGHDVLPRIESLSYASVLQGKIITKEVRIWASRPRFVNPVYERIEEEAVDEADVLFYAQGGPDLNEMMVEIERWKAESPLSKSPPYYLSCLLLAQGRMDEFLVAAERYLFIDKTQSMPTIMTRYYLAMAFLLHKKDYKSALQNLNLCLCARPLMAEFWCLTGDVFYHLLNRFPQAKEFYENAMILGSRRLKFDKWPMDISKYGSYPRKMIESCDEIVGSFRTDDRSEGV